MNKEHKLVNCICCGELFVKTDKPYCSRCADAQKAHVADIAKVVHFKHNTRNKTIEKFKKLHAEHIVMPDIPAIEAAPDAREINCRLCNAPIKVSSRKLVCDKCYSSLASSSNSVKKIVELRESLKIKERSVAFQRHASNRSYETIKKFSNNFKNYTITPFPGREIEILPDILDISKLKLSNSKNISHLVFSSY